MTKYRAKINKNVTENSYYPDYISKCVGKEIIVEDGVHGYYFGCLPKDNRKDRYVFDKDNLIDLEEITDETSILS